MDRSFRPTARWGLLSAWGPGKIRQPYLMVGTTPSTWIFSSMMMVSPIYIILAAGVSGIYVVALDPNDLTRFVGKPKHLFGFNNSHLWERYGEMNEYPDVAWIEGPWMEKRNGTFYLQYSASGTQWKTLCRRLLYLKIANGLLYLCAQQPVTT